MTPTEPTEWPPEAADPETEPVHPDTTPDEEPDA
jgi:hypothetical protein